MALSLYYVGLQPRIIQKGRRHLTPIFFAKYISTFIVIKNQNNKIYRVYILGVFQKILKSEKTKAMKITWTHFKKKRADKGTLLLLYKN